MYRALYQVGTEDIEIYITQLLSLGEPRYLLLYT